MNSSRDFDAENKSNNNLSFNNCRDKSPFHGIIIHDNHKRRTSHLLRDDVPFLTPIKNKDYVSRISLTPVSMVKNLRDPSPITGFKGHRHQETTIRYKENYRYTISSEKPKNRSPIFTTLFQQSVEKTTPSM